MAVTAEIPMPLDVVDADSVAFCPGIYQRLVEKVFDVRLMQLGEELRAFAVYSPSLDWRPDSTTGVARLEEVAVPVPLAAKVRKFVADAGLAFGCFDFAVDGEGEWWFLEVNESGQFLWIDHLLPGAGLFEQFLQYLAGGRPAFPRLSEFVFEPPSPVPGRLAPFQTEEV